MKMGFAFCAKYLGKIFLICLLLKFISCRNEDKKNGASKISEDDGYVTRCNLLGIDNLKEYKGNTQIRVWIEFSLSDTGKILIVKDTGDKWKATLINYRFDDMKNELTVKSKTILENTVSSVNQDFSNSLLRSGIYDINDSTRGREWNLCTDGGAMRVEFFKDDRYQEYIYPCYPESYNKTSLNRVVDFLKLCEIEFEFKIFPLDFPSINDSLNKIRIKKAEIYLK
jgi:hypothetical protein